MSGVLKSVRTRMCKESLTKNVPAPHCARLLILKFGAQLKEIQISPEHGEAYVKELRSYYFIHYGAQGVCEFFMWGGRITVRPVVCI